MDEVSDLLTTWGIPELIPPFAKNGITLQSLSALNLEEIKELVPLVGLRALFTRSWRVWLKAFTEENAFINKNLEQVDITDCNISVSALQEQQREREEEDDILQEQETQTTPEKNNYSDTISPNKIVTDNVGKTV